MRRALYLIMLVALCGALTIIVPATAAASGCGTPGDNQYIDPLKCNGNPGSNGGGAPPPGTNPSTSTQTATTPSTGTSPTATVANSTSTTATTTGTTSTSTSKAKDPASTKTLPYTGLDLAPALIVAVTLLGGGLLLRRVTRPDAS